MCSILTVKWSSIFPLIDKLVFEIRGSGTRGNMLFGERGSTEVVVDEPFCDIARGEAEDCGGPEFLPGA